jgi:hypothetical protein
MAARTVGRVDDVVLLIELRRLGRAMRDGCVVMIVSQSASTAVEVGWVVGGESVSGVAVGDDVIVAVSVFCGSDMLLEGSDDGEM